MYCLPELAIILSTKSTYTTVLYAALNGMCVYVYEKKLRRKMGWSWSWLGANRRFTIKIALFFSGKKIVTVKSHRPLFIMCVHGVFRVSRHTCGLLHMLSSHFCPFVLRFLRGPNYSSASHDTPTSAGEAHTHTHKEDKKCKPNKINRLCGDGKASGEWKKIANKTLNKMEYRTLSMRWYAIYLI